MKKNFIFEKCTPEQAGVSSKKVIEFIKRLEKRGANMHGVLFVRDDKIFAEGYWKPFHREFHHRQYSQTKSIVSIAIGLLEEEGKLSLDDKIVEHFPEKIEVEIHPYLKEQTIRDMLMMTTVGAPSYWFNSTNPDRTHHYLNEKRTFHPSGTIWAYDSAGSQVLCSLVEKLAGKSLLAYLKEKLFNEMGCFETATVLKVPNGDSWGDSAMVCTLLDMAALGYLTMHYGVWKDKRLMNEEYLKKATSNLTDNHTGFMYRATNRGYGYQIWRVCGNGFASFGMGDQLTVCYPDKNFMFVCNADNQESNDFINEIILTSLEDLFIDTMQDEPLPQDAASEKELQDLLLGLELRSAKGKEDSAYRNELNGKEYICEENPMGIKKFSFVFNDGKTGEFRYTNTQGDKVIPFGVNHNVFGKFPQLGYANEYGNVPTTDGFMYDDAASLAWLENKKLMLYVQIIDKYFGSVCARFSFKDDEVYACFTKVGECFLNEYKGELLGRKG